MIIKFKELKADFYVYSAKASEIFRQLSLAGIAIIWIFKKDDVSVNDYTTHLPDELVNSLVFFISALSLDFIHAFIPSIIYGIRVEWEDLKNTPDDTNLNLPFTWVVPTWLFYMGKVVLMVIGYITLFSYEIGLFK